jgi:hypothetical protein
MNDQFSLIPVTRSMPSRQHPEVSMSYDKEANLVVVFSPAFLGREDVTVKVGTRVLCGFDAETQRLCIMPAAEGAPGARVLGKRPGFAGAGQLVLSARNLPEGLPKWEGREAFTYAFGDEGAVIVNFNA